MQSARRTVLGSSLILAISFGYVAIARMSPADAAKAPASTAAPGKASPSATARQDSVATDSLIQPNELAGLVTGPTAHRPILVHVGFETLYKGGHIPGSIYAGPASEAEGLAALKKALQPISRQKQLVLYCGCCPWEDCPNVRAALHTARSMGFKHVRSLFIPRDLKQDWIDKGYPTSKS